MSARLCTASSARLRNGKLALAVAASLPPTPEYDSLQGGMIGQSNMEGMPKTPYLYPLGAVGCTAYSRGGVWQRIGNINDSRTAGEQSTLGAYTLAASDNGGPMNGDGYVFFVNALRAASGVPIRLIERAKGGSLISSWIDDGSDNNWNKFKLAVIAAGGGLDFVNWYQGEQNAHLLNPTTYIAALNSVYQQCLALSGRTADKFHFGVISIGVTDNYNSSTPGEFGTLRALLVDWANSTPGVFLATSAHDARTVDGVHNNGVSFGRIGNRAGKSTAVRFGFGVSGAGPRVSSFSRVGRAVTANIAHTGGTSLMDGAGGTAGTALTGFEFIDTNGVHTYSTAFVGGNIVCTLGRDVVGTLTGSYALMNCPHSASATSDPVLASIPHDNALYFGSSIGCPLQPKGLTTIP